MPRSSRLTKKVIRINQYTKRNCATRISDSLPVNEHLPDHGSAITSTPEPRPGSSATTPVSVSSSRKKLSLSNELFDCLPEDVSTESDYQIVDLGLLSCAVSKFVACAECGERDCVTVVEKSQRRNGLATKLALECANCNASKEFRNSKPTDNGPEVNLRFVYAMRTIGRGQQPSRMFCSVMGLPNPPTKFAPIYKKLNSALQTVAEESMDLAVQEAVAENTESVNPTDLFIALDGSWQKRGHTSHNGVVTITSVDTGKVLDVECLTNYCQGCVLNKTKKEEHKASCVQNYEGNSGGMEADGAVRMFRRSVQTRGVRYTKFLGDGDSKACKRVNLSLPYGDGVLVEKQECVGHVQKRVGSRMRRLKADYTREKKKCSDGKPLGGRGRLTDKEIDLLQIYYGVAIRANHESVSEMKRAIWATFFHRMSTNGDPNHGLCPKGSESWCGYNKAEAAGGSYDHDHSLPKAVLETIKPIYRDLTHDDLLSKCLHGKTQNGNESFNNVVWTRCPKTVFVGFNTFQVCAFDAVISFNDGNVGKVKVLLELGCTVGENTLRQLQSIDDARMKKADAAISDCAKAARKKKRGNKKKKNEAAMNPEEPEYGAGIDAL